MKKQTFKRALFMSCMSILLCVSMLIGTTYAWFTDSVSSANNIITSGNLDVELDYKKVTNGTFASGWETISEKTVFDENASWEPGHVEVAYLKVSNVGSLELKYQLSVNIANETQGVNVQGQEFNLSEHLVFKVVPMETEPTVPFTREQAKAAAGNTLGITNYNGGETTVLPVGQAHYVALIIYMPESVGNEINYKAGAPLPTINLGINLLATQTEAEN